MIPWLVVPHVNNKLFELEGILGNKNVDPFNGAPFCLGKYMSCYHFDKLIAVLSFTDIAPPAYVDRFWEVHQNIHC